MSNGRLKPQYNRVRTSTALQGNDMWAKTIGMTDEAAGSNSAIEATLHAPTIGGGNRTARRERAQQLIEASGYQPAVTSYAGLMSLARAQGNITNSTRGACRICGGLGHLTKQCKNGVSGHVAGSAALDQAAATAVGLALLPDPGTLSDFSDSSSSGSDSDDSGSDSDSSSDRRRKRKHKSSSHRSHDRERDHKRSKSSSSKGRDGEPEGKSRSRKEKSKSRKDKDRAKEKKHKKDRKEGRH